MCVKFKKIDDVIFADVINFEEKIENFLKPLNDMFNLLKFGLHCLALSKVTAI